ncbi:hypothetical protein RUM44_013338 [Polyplax serrata]|uniref:Uncharacterized protein n=1 Tax=Polyplax serrata TaxID=468196 RepID=A0ABR1BDW6_POLSC
MGTRSLLSGQPQSKTTPDRRMGFGHLEVKKEFRIKKEVQDEEIKIKRPNEKLCSREADDREFKDTINLCKT